MGRINISMIVKIPLVTVILMMSSGLLFASASHNNINNLQEKLIELRSIVDGKSEELSLLRQEIKQKQKYSISQISEIEADIEHKKMTLKKIESKLKKNRNFIKITTKSELLVKELGMAIDELTVFVSKSLPFKRASRLKALEDMSQQLLSGSVSAPRLANKLWAFVEDEIMLTKGNGIYRQIIALDNDEKLVDVARLGMMMLFFRDGAGEVGVAKLEQDGWIFKRLDGKDQKHQIHYLFDSFQKQVRFGEFNLPNSLVNVENYGTNQPVERGL